MNQLNVPLSSVEENYEDDEDMDDVEDSGAEEYSNDIELRDAEENIANRRAIQSTKGKNRRAAANSKAKVTRLHKSGNRPRQMSRIINNPTRQSLIDELANTHPIPTRHSTLTIDMDIQQSEYVPDNQHVLETQQEQEQEQEQEQQQQQQQQQQAVETYSNSLNTGSPFDTDIILANPTPSRDSVLPQPEPLVPPTLATSNTMYLIPEEQRGTFEEDTRVSRDKLRQNRLAVEEIIYQKQRDDDEAFKDAAARREAINKDAAQEVEAVLQDKVNGRDVNLRNEWQRIEQNRHRTIGKAEKARQTDANFRMAEAMRKLKKALPGEETDRREQVFKEDEKARHKIILEEENDIKEKNKRKYQAAIEEVARQEEIARQAAVQANSREDGTRLWDSELPSPERSRTPPDLPANLSGVVQEQLPQN
ncbi:hypothetical protein TGAMA5MH_10190 [Trichoderma gamsii]|uniref:Uncharacterized protein n=1 Tax=Trichoderma gamsii TaxID=398673 RepID=A0A2K0SXB6_9HYPO|nr:hypothetical protein TGAMA5MH_10190 [Trichoderma gamsii]